MDQGDFERRYREEGDPWGYRSRDYEAAKYAATLDACGTGPFDDALELGGSIGVFSALLAPRCVRLTTIDFAPAAVAGARRELERFPQATATCGVIPDDVPDGPFDLVVASEVLYYLDDAALGRTLTRLDEVMTVAGRLVVVHWRTNGPERPQTATDTHQRVRALSSFASLEDRSTSEYLLDVLAHG